ncbi:MAG: hypothetical protein KF768_12355 [Phycisphaeraceae bacterium]|nr:hypothetical protein [Phycisphaeraceae bacterium]
MTKILVVFCAILSLLLAALTMAYAANADALRKAYKNEQSARIAAEVSSKMEVTQAAERHAKDQSGLVSLQNELSNKEQALSNLRAENSRLNAENEQLKGQIAAGQSQFQQITALGETQAALIRQYSEEIRTLRDDLVSGAQREIELVDRINELESIREVLEQNQRALREQLEESRLALLQAQQGGLANGLGTAAIVRENVGPLIRARVVETFSSPTGDMVVISEGANRGVRENTRMHIVRGSQFIGSIVITAVEPTKSAGRIELLNDSARVQRDDTVLSRLTQ